MSYFSKPKTKLANVGADAFALLDGFSSGHKSKSSSSIISVPPSEPSKKLSNYQYQPEATYMIRQQLYVAELQTTRVETVIDSREAAKMYGGTVIVEYPKRKSARRVFFYR
ncbi:hypothetical protein L2E82_06756 [Cichorium intybus]|uniref:Uncharacterized protein n=1 Tax=Cichorium intybus TaxID=13427 RepID=A0ACB9HC60_CICIN|nr:hypothetical protein L2E82_06756 [Cichorium intybus]